MSRLKDWWYKQNDEQRRNTTRGAVFTLFVVSVMLFYYIERGPEEKPAPLAGGPSEQPFDSELLNADLNQRIQDAVATALAGKMHDLQLIQQANQATPELDPEEMECAGDDLECLDGIGEPKDYNSPTYPPEAPNYTPAPHAEAQSDVEEIPFAPKLIGGINSESFGAIESQSPSSDTPTTQSEITIPVGFMPASLLVGVQAQVSNDASGQPKPIHLRVQAPATLPNHLKINLKGCFVVANTWGNLASERIEGELVSMNCITNDTKTLISGPIRGYIADTDGQRDMTGIVVTNKTEALLKLQILADTLSGIGKSVGDGTGDISTSVFGNVTTRDDTDHLKAGLASGISSGLNGASEYIRDLIIQTGPVIEKGPTANVMLMVQETATLTVRRI